MFFFIRVAVVILSLHRSETPRHLAYRSSICQDNLFKRKDVLLSLYIVCYILLHILIMWCGVCVHVCVYTMCVWGHPQCFRSSGTGVTGNCEALSQRRKAERRMEPSTLFCVLFWDKICLCSPGWLCTCSCLSLLVLGSLLGHHTCYKVTLFS